MPDGHSHPKQPDSQRNRAEEIVRARAVWDPENAGTLSAEAARQLLHDLRVHQIELEMQNEELRRAQEEIEAARTRYFDLYDLAPVGYVTVSQAGVVREANLTASGLLGIPRNELVTRHLTSFIVGEDQDLYFRLRRALFATATPQVCELRLVRKDGHPLWVRLQAAGPQELDGAPVFRAAISDITERKRAEETVRASEALHRLLFESSHDALMTLGPPGWAVTAVNPATVALFGARDQADFASRPLWHYSPLRQPDGPASSEKAATMIDRAMRDGSHRFEWTFERVGGGEFAASVLLTRMEIDGQPLLQATVRDETEVKRLQSELAQADRLGSMGMLAAGVAHEINNPLTYVLFSARTLAADLPRIAGAATRCRTALCDQLGEASFAQATGGDAAMLDPSMLEDVCSRAQEVLAGADRIREISLALGNFSRVEQAERSMVDLNHAIDCAITMASNEIKFRATLVKDFGRVPGVWASAGKLSQVFLNLLINASRSIAEGSADRNRISVRTWVEGDDVLAQVDDTGGGIAPENLARVFEPFFTTKPTGLGSGLGLAICRTIITEFGGDIRVESEVGKGTRFVVRLPVATQRLPPPGASAGGETAPARAQRGRVLIIDDEPLILKSLTRLLGRTHEVMTAPSGDEGRAILERDQAFDVILCDLMMPEITGMDLHAWLAQRFPELTGRMVFISGGAFTPQASHYLAELPNLRIVKPLDPVVIEKVVLALMAGREATATSP